MNYSNFSSSFGLMLAVSLLVLVNGEHFKFGYIDGPNGPSQWGYLHKEWEACLGNGHRQSPIHLNFTQAKKKKQFIGLNRAYNKSRITMVNKGYSIMMRFENPYVGGFVHSGTIFYLRQLHWHQPSEHIINGERFAVEMHMVHTTQDNEEAAVIAVLYELGSSPDMFLAKVENYIRKISGTGGQEIDAGMINPNKTIQKSCHGYYRYMGSLTTPPCTEGVIWTVMEQIRPISAKQVKMLKRAVETEFKKNARPIQAIHDRQIKLYQPNNLINPINQNHYY